MVLVGLLTFIAFIFINNTIRLSITARRREIAIMRLIGAKNSFIKAPFLIEGIVIGLVGAIFPLILLYFLYNKLITYVGTQFTGLSNVMDFLPGEHRLDVVCPADAVLPGDLCCTDSGRRDYRSLWFCHRHAPLPARVGMPGIHPFQRVVSYGAARFLSPRDHLGRLLGCKRQSIVRRRHGAQ